MKKHGRCSGLSGEDFYRLSCLACYSVTRPPILRRLPRDLDVPLYLVYDAKERRWLL